jgi:hypothetical protein
MADFGFDIAHDGRPAASFHLKYVIDGLSMVVAMENVVEHPGFELIEVGLPNLATVREEDGAAWMALGRDGRELVELQHAKETHLPDDPYFGRLWKYMPVAMVGGSRVWSGHGSDRVGLAKYMQEGWGKKRIDFMLNHYGINDAILIDALSWYAIRNDWDRRDSGRCSVLVTRVALVKTAISWYCCGH